ncbi:hypothetical protein CBR_g49898 [Chara braunii]|uniref:Uncharacterized protein n=1 Tax=Chara braunii TaxID=69332 RepID=A0A388JPB4_CHABU|nr:hypothetical protein CBR_g49898 [Chara braunii]|eukprot:GBG59634.1 hypothetical protein CBR_g49898 [Chara braunii]
MGHFARDCADYWQAKALGRTFVPSSFGPSGGRTGRTADQESIVRRSRSAESGDGRTEIDDTSMLMREYLVAMAQERRDRIEREATEERRRLEEEARLERERRRAEKMKEKQQYEEERDARLLSLIDMKMKKEEEVRRGRSGWKGPVVHKTNEYGETMEEEKERLRRMIASCEEREVDDELPLLRKQAANLKIADKRNRGPEGPVGNSPLVMTPEKRTNVKLSEDSRRRIEELRSNKNEEPQTSGMSRKIDLTLKHISTACGPGGKEKYEVEVRDFYDALTIDELKEVCRMEKVCYENREMAIKRLVIRRVAIAYNAAYLPLPATPRVITRSVKTGETKAGVEKKKP